MKNKLWNHVESSQSLPVKLDLKKLNVVYLYNRQHLYTENKFTIWLFVKH